jgi:hypothetical protein
MSDLIEKVSPADFDLVMHHLEACLAVFEKKNGLMSGNDIRIKSLLGVVRNEVAKGAGKQVPAKLSFD